MLSQSLSQALKYSPRYPFFSKHFLGILHHEKENMTFLFLLTLSESKLVSSLSGCRKILASISRWSYNAKALVDMAPDETQFSSQEWRIMGQLYRNNAPGWFLFLYILSHEIIHCRNYSITDAPAWDHWWSRSSHKDLRQLVTHYWRNLSARSLNKPFRPPSLNISLLWQLLFGELGKNI